MWFVYILLCSDQSLYTGITNNLGQRFKMHKSGKASKYTRAKKAVKIVYTEELEHKPQALKRELEIKSWPKEKKIKVLNLIF